MLETEESARDYNPQQQTNSKYALDECELQIPDIPEQVELAETPIVVDQDFQDLLVVQAEDVSSWDQAGSCQNVSVYKKMTEDSPIVLLKAYALIEGVTTDIVYEVITNQEVRRSWDKVLSNFEILQEDPGDGISVLYFMIKTPIGVSNRDFVQQRKVKKDFPQPGFITMHFKSVSHPKCPEKPHTVRGDTLISGYIIEPDVDSQGRPSTKLTIISQNDIKGVIPKAIVNMLSGKAPRQWVGNLVKGCEDYMKTMKK
ncbi:hypothetical protein FGO68_gene8647 [Halteria grandinella]|uniref:Phosphatidylcholine transfer protein n=1 Tax=Halteria grandinella TaxID=5974 RepID=A0A8J8T5P4_HALGN|nr:hypothetical protein FGO68_gene8647 [Halteria grandinella]